MWTTSIRVFNVVLFVVNHSQQYSQRIFARIVPLPQKGSSSFRGTASWLLKPRTPYKVKINRGSSNSTTRRQAASFIPIINLLLASSRPSLTPHQSWPLKSWFQLRLSAGWSKRLKQLKQGHREHLTEILKMLSPACILKSFYGLFSAY